MSTQPWKNKTKTGLGQKNGFVSLQLANVNGNERSKARRNTT